METTFYGFLWRNENSFISNAGDHNVMELENLKDYLVNCVNVE